MIKLYGVSGSRAFRSLWMLEELGLEYEHIKTNFTGDSRKPDFLKINPNGHIPALVDGDLVLFESLAINLYLARKHDAGLWPKGLEDEARTYQWSIWAMTEVEPPLLQLLFHTVFLPEKQRDPKLAKEAEEKLQAPLAVLEGALEGRPYLLGPSFTVADLNVAAVASWTSFAGTDLSRYPNVSRYLQECLARPASQKARSL